MIVQRKQVQFFIKWKEVLTSSFVFIVCLILFYSFPANGTLQNISRSLFFMLIVPLLYVRIILKKDARYFGFSFSEYRKGFLWLGGALLVALLISYALINYTGFKNAYADTIPLPVYNNFRAFLLYELFFVNFMLFLHTAFFNGFVLFTFKEIFGYWSILIVTLSFLGFLLAGSVLDWRMAPWIIAIPLGAWSAYENRSFAYAYLTGTVFMIILDAYVIYMFK